MGLIDILVLAVVHPHELRALITYKVWRDPLNDIKADPEASGWNRESMRTCWDLLDATSRSFGAVIKELKGELSRVICIFYLVLRGLDTIEDDMTIDAEKKIPLLRNFHKVLEQPGWTFTESESGSLSVLIGNCGLSLTEIDVMCSLHSGGPDEKDRELLIQFDKVIEEYQRLDSGYKLVIADMTARMGAGMASYIAASASSPLSVQRWKDYDLYCHFVAGLVGEGLSRLFAQSDIERPWLGDQLALSNHMGLFLQKTNIIRDYAEDCAEGRHFWPKECWGAPGADFKSQADVARGIVAVSRGAKHYRPEGEEGERAMFVLSSMLLDAVSHATRALDYLSLLREQSVFNFCAIPQVMAIATLNAMMANPDVFRRNVKIRKSQAVQLILRSVNPRDVSYLFLDFAREMRSKLQPKDPNYVKWSIELSRIELWCENYYPSFVSAATEGKPADARAAAMKKYAQERAVIAKTKAAELKRDTPSQGVITSGGRGIDARREAMTPEELEEHDKQERNEMIKFFAIMLVGMTVVMGAVALAGWMIAWYALQEGQDPLSLWLGELYHSEYQGVERSRTFI